MRRPAVCLFCLAIAALPVQAAQPASASIPVESELSGAKKPELPASAPLRARIDDDAIRNAVRATLDEAREHPRQVDGDTISGTPYEEFGREFSEAKVPDCLHPDGLKRQPTFFLGGLLALPFVAVAKIRGKCR